MPKSREGFFLFIWKTNLDSLEDGPKRVDRHYIIHSDWGSLESLRGCPNVIPGSFDINGTEVGSLRHGPSKVGGYYDCSSCVLTSLKGAPTEVGGSFYAQYNNLNSLDYLPNKIGGDIAVKYQGTEGLDCVDDKFTELDIPSSTSFRGKFGVDPDRNPPVAKIMREIES